jgi:hypothetical protein
MFSPNTTGQIAKISANNVAGYEVNDKRGGPIAGAGLPDLMFASGGLLALFAADANARDVKSSARVIKNETANRGDTGRSRTSR